MSGMVVVDGEVAMERRSAMGEVMQV
jgi:hypothetical protein